MSIIDDILHDKAGDPLAAGVTLALRLMESDPAECKVGYTDENAAYAAETAYGLSDEDRQEVLRTLREEWRPGDITVDCGMFDGVRYEHTEWYVYRWVIGGGEGHWNPILGPYDTETLARVAYAQKQQEWAL